MRITSRAFNPDQCAQWWEISLLYGKQRLDIVCHGYKDSDIACARILA
jgi:hypothetical protein